MAATEVYVDPSIAGNSGAGTVGDPYGDLQYALDTVTRNSTDGDRFNIKAGTSEFPAAIITLVTYGAPSVGAPVIFQGYTSAANDGGIGVVDMGAGSGFIVENVYDYVHIVDMRIHNFGAASGVKVKDGCKLVNVEIDGSTLSGGWGVDMDDMGVILRCSIHDIRGQGIRCLNSAVLGCYFKNDGTWDFTEALSFWSQHGNICANNIFDLDGASGGIIIGGDNGCIINNTIYAVSGTGKGIALASGHDGLVILNNYIEGFSGSGGIAISMAAGSSAAVYGHNKFFNNATAESLSGVIHLDLGNSSTLGSSALTNPGAGDFSVGTDLKAAGYPSAFHPDVSTNQFIDVGAAQRQETGGGAAGIIKQAGVGGGMVG